MGPNSRQSLEERYSSVSRGVGMRRSREFENESIADMSFVSFLMLLIEIVDWYIDVMWIAGVTLIMGVAFP